MSVKIEGFDEHSKPLDSLLKIAQIGARRCYSNRSVTRIKEEPLDKEFLMTLVKSGHHSVFGHPHIMFHLTVPKALAIVLNNQQDYDTSEQSARYTKMNDLEPDNERLYSKWKAIFMELIRQKYPEPNNAGLYLQKGKKKTPHETIAMENARDMTSVFTDTQLVYTANLRQLNYCVNWFKDFIQKEKKGRFDSRLSELMQEFISHEAISGLIVEGLKDTTDRGLNQQPIVS